MKCSHALVTYLMLFFSVIANIPQASAGEYQASEYPEAKQYEYHHHDYHPPPPKKSGNVDINIPFDFGTIAKFGILGLTQLKLLMALGKIATAGLGVSALGLSQLGKIGLSLPISKGGIAIDIGAGGHHQAKTHTHYEHHAPSEKHY